MSTTHNHTHRINEHSLICVPANLRRMMHTQNTLNSRIGLNIPRYQENQRLEHAMAVFKIIFAASIAYHTETYELYYLYVNIRPQIHTHIFIVCAHAMHINMCTRNVDWRHWHTMYGICLSASFLGPFVGGRASHATRQSHEWKCCTRNPRQSRALALSSTRCTCVGYGRCLID